VNCKAIIYRNHIRKVYSTPESPTDEDLDKLSSIEDALDDLIAYKDYATSVWYKINGNDDGNGTSEIWIVDENGKVNPLSSYSNIVRNMGTIKQIRLYVWPEDRHEAEKILRSIN